MGWELNAPTPKDWFVAVFAIKGRPKLGGIFVMVSIYAILVVTLIQVSADSLLEDTGEKRLRLRLLQTARSHESNLKLILETIKKLPSLPIRISCSGLFFLMAYRTSVSYQKFTQ